MTLTAPRRHERGDALATANLALRLTATPGHPDCVSEPLIAEDVSTVDRKAVRRRAEELLKQLLAAHGY